MRVYCGWNETMADVRSQTPHAHNSDGGFLTPSRKQSLTPCQRMVIDRFNSLQGMLQ